jgi:hypothetical protein
MEKIDLGQAITISANIGVIAGIVFLGFELRQNNRLIASEALAVRASMNQTGWGYLVENPDLVALLVRDQNGESLTEEEQFRLNAMWMKNLAQRQFEFFENPDSADWTAGQRRNSEAYSSIRNSWNGVGPGSTQPGNDNFDLLFVQFYEENVVDPR